MADTATTNGRKLGAMTPLEAISLSLLISNAPHSRAPCDTSPAEVEVLR